MIAVLSHNIAIGDVLSHEGCGASFHYLALRWSLDHLEGGKAALAEKAIPVMICPKCHLDNDSAAALKVAQLIYDKVVEAITPKSK